MLRQILKPKIIVESPLGRWGAIIKNTKNDNSILRENSIDFNSNWANHDHCGADACQITQHITKYANDKTFIKTNNDNNTINLKNK